jgi:putative membrane protein
MTYLRSLFLNFLAVFFINNVMGGIEITFFENVPNIGFDLLFSIVLGLINSLIFPMFFLFEIKVTIIRLAIISFFISFLAYTILAIFPLGIKIIALYAWFFCSFFIFLVSFLSNYLEYKHSYKK